MTPYAHILDALKTMEERGVEPSMADFAAMADLIAEEEEKQDIMVNPGSIPAMSSTLKTKNRI